MNLYETLMRLDSVGRAMLIARAGNYISNSDFLNLLNNIDVNRKQTIAPVCNQLRAFESIPDMRAKIAAWLRS